MVLFKKSLFSLLIISLSCGFSPLTEATNGSFLHGYGTKNKALGGSGSANPQDAHTAANNPAGMVHIGNRFDFSTEILIADRGYKLNGTEEVHSDTFMLGAFDGFFVIPAIGYNHMINDKSSIGFSIYGSGIGTDYRKENTPSFQQLILPDTPAINRFVELIDPDHTVIKSPLGINTYNLSKSINGTFLDGDTQLDVLLAILNISYSRIISDDLSLGVGLVVAAQSLKTKGLILFTELSQEPEKVNGNGRDWAVGAGLSLGVQYDIVEDVTLAASYQSEIELVHDKYAGFIAGEGRMNMPQNATFGAAFRMSETAVFSFDFQWINFSGIPATGNRISDFDLLQITGGAQFNRIGNANGPGLGSKDAFIYKVGNQWKFDADSSLTWRIGFSHMEQIMRPAETLVGSLAPATITTHYTAGMSWQVDADTEFSLSLMYAPKTKVDGLPSSFSLGIDYLFLEEYSIEMALAFRFGNK
ncbi:MAG: hypothetical protein HON94_15805 [Methylococcales bacterium]|jgi:long-chain fatty acid transport protein|nr:hypothetical protein [Methylococcales bacterium]